MWYMCGVCAYACDGYVRVCVCVCVCVFECVEYAGMCVFV